MFSSLVVSGIGFGGYRFGGFGIGFGGGRYGGFVIFDGGDSFFGLYGKKKVINLGKCGLYISVIDRKLW